MEQLGSEAPEASRRSLRAAVLGCLIVTTAGGYAGMAQAYGGLWSDGRRNEGTVVVHMPPRDNVVNVYAPRYGMQKFGGLGAGGTWEDAWGGDTGGFGGLNYIPEIPDVDMAHRSPDKGSCGDLVGNPVVASTGNKVEVEVDFSTANDDGLSLRREYNHYWSGTGVFGGNWISNHDASIVYSNYEPGACASSGSGQICDRTKAHTITAWRPDARRLRYEKGADGKYRSVDFPSSTYLEFDSFGRALYHAEDRTLELYGGTDGTSWIISRTSATGETWTYDYVAPGLLRRVTFASGRYIDFIRDSSLRVTSVRDPAGNYHSYAYRSVAGKPAISTSHSQTATGTGYVPL